MQLDSSPTHVVLGAGQIGGALALRLHHSGHRVRVIRQSGRQLPDAPHIEVVAGDVRDADTLAAMLLPGDVVYGCTNPAHYHRWATQLPPLYRGTWRAAAKAGARLVVLDNLYRYGRVDEIPFDETTPYRPCSDKGRLRVQLAAELAEAVSAGLDARVGLASDFFGPGTDLHSMFGTPTLIRMARGQRVPVFGDTTLPRAYSYSADVVEGLLALGTERIGWRPQNPTWHLPVAFCETTDAFLQSFADVLGQPVRTLQMSAWVLRTMGLFVRELSAMPEMLYQWEHPYVPDDGRFEADFGQRATRFESAVATTLAHADLIPLRALAPAA